MRSLNVIILFLLFSSCTRSSTVNSKELLGSDTLNVSYTYWWPSGGPFIGLCGDPYSFVFTGTVTKLYPPFQYKSSSEVLLQKGVIKINDIKYKGSPEKDPRKSLGYTYSNEHYFSSDCFYDLNLKEGDKVVVFIYSYEGEYSIPAKSILKLESFTDPILTSLEKYIKSNQDALAIKDDINSWKKYNLDKALEQIIDCKIETHGLTAVAELISRGDNRYDSSTGYWIATYKILDIKNGNINDELKKGDTLSVGYTYGSIPKLLPPKAVLTVVKFEKNTAIPNFYTEIEIKKF